MPGPWLLGFIDPIEDVAYFSYRLKLIPEELRGRVLGVCRLFSYISGTLGIFLTGLSLQFRLKARERRRSPPTFSSPSIGIWKTMRER
ncbi:MAG: hypothetical protein H0U76_11350 [Ktedonobacteraceae bacterium]|nr:hypothetical protein [Ktedonobacteraceae bacterium]